MACDFSELSAYLDGELSEADRRRIESHIKECAACTAEFEELKRAHALLSDYAAPYHFHAKLLKKLPPHDAEPVSVRQAHTIRTPLPYAAMAVLAATVILIVALWAGGWFSSHRRPPAVETTDVAQKQPMPDSETIEPAPADFEPPQEFQDTEPVPHDDAVPVTPREPRLPLALAGTIHGKVAKAILVATDTGKQTTYEVGATVLPGVRLVRVDKNSVELDNRGTKETLTMGDIKGGARTVTLDGPWKLTIMSSSLTQSSNEVTLNEKNGRLEVVFEEGAELPPLEGTLVGRQAALEWRRGPQEVWKLRGEFDEAFTELNLGVEVQSADSAHAQLLQARLERASSDAASAGTDDLRALRLQREEVELLYEPIGRYASHNEGRLPDDLSELVPGYVENLDSYKTTRVRAVHYLPGAAFPDRRALAAVKANASLPMPERLNDVERRLGSLWGREAPLTPAVLEVTFTEPPRQYAVTADGIVCDLGNPASSSTTSAATLNEQRIESQRKLKQVAFAIKQYLNENELYTPPGWLSLYPNYLNDMTVLTAPWDEPGVLSYDYLVPARHRSDLLEQARRLASAEPGYDPDRPDLDALILSRVPVVTEKDTAPRIDGAPRGRNVLFLDGHVEFLSDDAWTKTVGPFLQ